MNFPWWWSKASHRKWSGIRARGVRHFILVRGLLIFGVSALAVSLIIPAFFGQSVFVWRSIVETLLICAAGAFVWAVVTWYLNERAFSKYSEPAP